MVAIFSTLRLSTTAASVTSTLQVSGMFSAGTNAVAPLNYYTPGYESPAVSTADYYHVHACQYLRPIDLDACGSAGAAVKAANGANRYAWISTGEHPEGGTGIWRDSWGFMIGFSNDPGVFPAVMDNAIPFNNLFTGSAGTPGANGYTIRVDMAPTSLVYNTDDATNPFYLYAQGIPSSLYIGTQGIVLKSSTLFDWTLAAWGPKSIDAANPPGPQLPLTSFQAVERIGTGNWIAHGAVGDVGIFGAGKWTSSDGMTWTYPGSTAYNRGAYPALNFALSGTTLTAASSIFTSGDTGKGILVANTAGSGLQYITMTYVSGTQATLSSNQPGLSFSSQAAMVQYGPVITTTALASDGTGGVSSFSSNLLSVTSGGSRYRLAIEDARHQFQVTDDGMWMTLVPVDADYNVSQVVPGTHISSQYAGFYPGPTYLISLAQYQEDGILHAYLATGYPGPHGVTPMPYVGASVLGSISGTTLTVTSVTGIGNIVLGAYVFYSSSASIGYVTAFGTGTGGTGTYTITNPGAVTAAAGSSIDLNGGRYGDTSSASTGGLNEQFIDYYTITLDSASAVAAAPFGVSASCSSNTVTVTWMQSLLHAGTQSYNVYRGTTSGTQATLVGSTSALSITDTPTPGSVYYYRVVKVANGSEQASKYRIVHTYVG